MHVQATSAQDAADMAARRYFFVFLVFTWEAAEASLRNYMYFLTVFFLCVDSLRKCIFFLFFVCVSWEAAEASLRNYNSQHTFSSQKMQVLSSKQTLN
jgi:hypothetical protein